MTPLEQLEQNNQKLVGDIVAMAKELQEARHMLTHAAFLLSCLVVQGDNATCSTLLESRELVGAIVKRRGAR